MGKGTEAGYQHFLLFPQCVQRPSSGAVNSGLIGKRLNFRYFGNICDMLLIVINKVFRLVFPQGLLTHYQMTNCRLFQTVRVCRWQFQIWRKWQNVIQMGRKHCGKRRNCSLRAISPFPTVFSKGLFPRGVKRRHCVGMGQTCSFWNSFFLTISLFISQ